LRTFRRNKKGPPGLAGFFCFKDLNFTIQCGKGGTGVGNSCFAGGPTDSFIFLSFFCQFLHFSALRTTSSDKRFSLVLSTAASVPWPAEIACQFPREYPAAFFCWLHGPIALHFFLRRVLAGFNLKNGGHGVAASAIPRMTGKAGDGNYFPGTMTLSAFKTYAMIKLPGGSRSGECR